MNKMAVVAVELPMDCGTACGPEDLLKDVIDVDM